jgi:hypothetical protein
MAESFQVEQVVLAAAIFLIGIVLTTMSQWKTIALKFEESLWVPEHERPILFRWYRITLYKQRY